MNKCILCQSVALEPCYQNEKAVSVTSDGKVWPEPPLTFFCADCGHLQKLVDQNAKTRNDQIYSNYEIFHLSDGNEQLKYDDVSKTFNTRSHQIIKHLNSLPTHGKVLDFGCGNGAFLKAFSQLHSDWELYGLEQSTLFREQVLSIAGVRGFYSDLDTCTEKFDLISLIHVFEHLDTPIELLATLQKFLNPNGQILIQVPNIAENPFDTVVADHYSHFTPNTLKFAVSKAGFTWTNTDCHWIFKEISLLLCVAPASKSHKDYEHFDHLQDARWLNEVVDQVQALPKGVGIFGTAIAGTWVGGMLNDHIGFFVDEDPSRVGKTYLGKPVILPNEISEGEIVFISLPVQMAQAIADRLENSCPGNFVVPDSNMVLV